MRWVTNVFRGKDSDWIVSNFPLPQGPSVPLKENFDVELEDKHDYQMKERGIVGREHVCSVALTPLGSFISLF